MPLMRLQKLLAKAGVCSRRTGEALIRAGRVAVNGKTVTVMGIPVDPSKDRVKVDGKPVDIVVSRVYIALNKPKGVVSSCSQRGERIVLDLVELETRLFPVGRLDKDSTGLLILTNDGSLHHRLLHPSFDHEKEYEVTTALDVDNEALSRMESGMPLMGEITRPARVKRISSSCFRIVIKEGKNRQIRRMVEKLGNRVKNLKRIRFAGIGLGRLPEGKWRHLTPREIRRLKEPIRLSKVRAHSKPAFGHGSSLDGSRRDQRKPWRGKPTALNRNTQSN